VTFSKNVTENLHSVQEKVADWPAEQLPIFTGRHTSFTEGQFCDGTLWTPSASKQTGSIQRPSDNLFAFSNGTELWGAPMSASCTLKSHGLGQSPSAELVSLVSVYRVLPTDATTVAGVCNFTWDFESLAWFRCFLIGSTGGLASRGMPQSLPLKAETFVSFWMGFEISLCIENKYF
jgi:hypothetical protein